jgi:hypothetical protein
VARRARGAQAIDALTTWNWDPGAIATATRPSAAGVVELKRIGPDAGIDLVKRRVDRLCIRV